MINRKYKVVEESTGKFEIVNTYEEADAIAEEQQGNSTIYTLYEE